jgi:hypothetical protein
MSLHVLANHMSTKGRNGDSMLVHMTPNEVQGLQALAMKHGGSLTINPDTGLPEANFLKKLLPMIAGFALGPAGMGIAFGGLSSAASAGLLVGGVTGLATGSLSKGLMAGLGAYGGAGLGAGLESAGSASIGSAAEGIQGPIGSPESGFGATQAIAAAPKADVLSAGFNAATASPTAAMNFAKQNMMPLAAAASPIMADMMVPTTTKAPTNTNPAYIRQYVAGDRPQAPRALAPVLASEWGARNFSDAYATPMAGGGIVALADGGDVQHFAIGDLVKADIDKAYAAGDYARVNELAQANKITAADVADTYKGFDTSGLAGLGINLFTPPAAPTYNQYTNEQIGKYLTDNPTADIAAATKTTNADPVAVNRYIASLTSGYTDPTATKGGSGTAGFYNQLTAQGIDPNEYYAAMTAVDPNYATQGFSKADIAEQYGIHKGAYALSDQLKGNVSDANWANFMDTNNYSVLDAARAFGLSTDEVQRRYDAANAQRQSVVPGAVQLPGATVYDNGAFGNYGSGNKTGVDYQGNTVSIATPGDILTNPDNSRTVTPNAPGRPYGGFTGIENLKSAYTAGGGSLGYTPYIPTTPEEHDKLYNTQGSDSLAAYNYLIGKGAGTPGAARYPTRSVATEIAKPYEEAVLGYPTDLTKKKYINVDGKMVKNPVYVEPKTQSEKTASAATAAKAGKAPSITITDSSGYNTETITAVLQDNGTYLGNNNKRYDASGKELAAMGGMMGYAVGGGLGSLGSYSDGGRLLKGPGDGVSDSIPATIGQKQQPARLADGEFVVPARIVSELGNGSTEAGARKLYAMMDRVQKARGKTTGKNKVAANSRADKYLPA